MGRRIHRQNGWTRPKPLRRTIILAASVLLTLGLAAPPAAAQQTRQSPQLTQQSEQNAGPAKVLVFHGPAAEQEDPVARAAEAIGQVAADAGMTVETSSDPGAFTAANLREYRGVVFLSAAGAELSAQQEAALQGYIADGGGFLGVRDAARAQVRSEWFGGLVGARPAGARPVPLPVTEATASAENPPNETAADVVDGNVNTKWLAFDSTGWITVRLEEPAAVSTYALTSANDAAGRDPQDWTLQGSADGTSWSDVDTRAGETFPERLQTKQFEFENTATYEYYRLNITANAGAAETQLAELELYSGELEPPPAPQPQQATVSVVDGQHPATEGLPQLWERTDVWHNWETNPVGSVHTIAQVQEHTYDPGNNGNGPFHPISWCHDYDGGRSFYTGMGGMADNYADPKFLGHLRGALLWTTGMVRGDCQATIAANYEIERLTGVNTEGQLDQHGENHEMTIAADGTVFIVGKAACPSGPIPDWEQENIGLGCGTIHQWDAENGVKLLGTLDVFGNRGSGNELIKSEEGLLGVTTDPDFADNGWLYLYWMPYESIDKETRIGKRTVSRFTYDSTSDTLDLSSRKDLLHWDTQIHSCCHAGGGMDFDDEGNLFVATGDSNSSQGSEGYSGNNWTQEYQGVSFQDARRTAGNTNDLNGKILRIHPEPDGTYSIPEGNLFPESEDPGDKTRPEIYVMGVRNPSRLHYDHVNDWVTTAWVGPDAGAPSPELGPAKYEHATVLTEPGNQGWPYCMGNRQPYRDRSNEDAEILTGWYDCDNPQNNSPRNTGLVDLPPVRDNMIWYSPQCGGPVFPDRGDGSGVPSYLEEEMTCTQPYLTGGAQAIMDGPTYHSSEVDTGSGVAWPSYWDGKWFLGDESNANNRVAVTIDRDGVAEHKPPLFAEDLRKIIPGGGGDRQLQHWMGAEFGPDGALYLIDYGSGFFSLSDHQKLLRVSYKGGAPTPRPAATATARQDRSLTMAFTGSRSGGVSYHWDFGDGATSTKANPEHRYAELGTYTAKLTVTYADGEKATTSTKVEVGCPVPDARDTVWLRDSDTGVANHAVGGGCTVGDLIDDERTWADHGAFVDHVTTVANKLKEDGVLTGREHGQLTSAAARSEIGKPGDTGYLPIFNGTAESLADWRQAPGGHFELRPDGSLRTIGGLGMLWYTGQEFGDFSLRLQFRDVATGDGRSNSGVLVRFPDPRTPVADRPECGTVGSSPPSEAWVAIYCGHEIQIYDGETGEPQKTGSVYNFAPVSLDQAGATPKGEWSEYEIRVVGQHYTIIRNGVVISEFENAPGKESSREGDPPTDLRQFVSGFIGLQNHGDADLTEFRNIRVRPL